MVRRSSAAQKYTHPALRERIKEALRRSNKGGRPGQWSARKSQLLVKEYERRGGGYRGRANRAEATALHHWTEQAWQTRRGLGRARGRGAMARYLPAAAWARLTPAQRARADASKRAADRKGAQRAAWPDAIGAVMRAIEHDERGAAATRTELYLRAKQRGIRGRSKMSRSQLRRALAKRR